MLRCSHTNEQALKAATYSHSINFQGRGRGTGRDRESQDRGDGYKNYFRVVDNFGKGRGEGRGHLRAVEGQNRGRGRIQLVDKSKVECFRCHNLGHYRSECYARMPNDKGELSYFAEQREEETLLMVVETTQE